MNIHGPMSKEQIDKVLDGAKAHLEAIFEDHRKSQKPPTPEYVERVRKAQEELDKIAAAKTEAERIDQLHAAINRKHRYRAKSQTGKVHEFEHMPHFTHLVVINQDRPDEHYNYCTSREIAERVKENVLLSKEEHQELARGLRTHAEAHNDADSLRLAEHRERLAVEAEGKTAEIMEMHVIENIAVHSKPTIRFCKALETAVAAKLEAEKEGRVAEIIDTGVNTYCLIRVTDNEVDVNLCGSLGIAQRIKSNLDKEGESFDIYEIGDNLYCIVETAPAKPEGNPA